MLIRFLSVQYLLFIFIVVGLIPACSGGGGNNPKDIVIRLFGAMERDEKAAVAHLLDIPALMEIEGEDYALQRKTPRKFYNPEDILNDLTGEGLTKSIWFSMQRVIGSTKIVGDTAFVEVSFIDKGKGIQYFNKFGLHKKDGIWKIYSFKTISR